MCERDHKQVDPVQKVRSGPREEQQAYKCQSCTGCVKRHYHFVLRDDAVPVVQPARRVPLSLREPLREELQRMEQGGIIAKVTEPTDWRKGSNVPPEQGNRRFSQDLRVASQTAEFMWRQVLPRLPRRKAPPTSPQQDVVVLGNASVPLKVNNLLVLGPQYCEHPRLDKTQLLSLVRTAARRVRTDEAGRCIKEGVDSLPQEVKKGSTRRLTAAVSALKDAGVKLVQSDKEGGFVVVVNDLYKEKAQAAVAANFRQVKTVKPSKVQEQAVQLCERAGLSRLASSVKASKASSLFVFFSAKTHKVSFPFRVIVSERGTWQREVAVFLQKCLSHLEVEDPFLIRKPETVSEFLQNECPAHVGAFSVDVKDLYYSLPQSVVIAEISKCIDRHGGTKFQNSSGINVSMFLEMLRFYLKSTFARVDDSYFIQKQGVCIESSLAPVLSDLFLASCDRQLQAKLDGTIVKVMRYVDDFLVFYRKSNAQQTVAQIFDVFSTELNNLQLTTELPTSNKLRFLDLELVLSTTPLEAAAPPAAILQGRKLRTTLPAIQDSPGLHVVKHRQTMNNREPLPPLIQGDVVRVKKLFCDKKASVTQHCAQPKSYNVFTEDGRLLRRNRKHLMPTKEA
ncbi:uncharacterized protein LOC144113013 [Amblyomma americanum]